MRKSTWSLEKWMDSIEKGKLPTGEKAQIIKVEDGEIVEIWYSGGQTFGSGGYTVQAIYAGNEPQKLEDVNTRDTGFICEHSAKFKLTAPCIIWEYSGDGINGGRTFRNNVYVCK